nr:alpha/beta hydrolase [Streptomyces sp. NBC_00830]
MTTQMLETPEVDLAYDVHGPLPTTDGRPPLVMIGQPMDASGFGALASHFPERTVITYDPRGLGRSTRKDGRVDHAPRIQAADVRAVIEALGGGPVEMFASSGGAVTALALVAAYPDGVTTLVAHEPPLIPVLPDAQAAERARAGVRDAYEEKGWGAGMAAFIMMTSWQGEFTEESWDTLTGRTSAATAKLLGQQATVFPSHHGGFLDGEFGYAGQPEAFARKLREVLDDVS